MLSINGELISTGSQHPYVNWQNGFPKEPMYKVSTKIKKSTTKRVLARLKDLEWFANNSLSLEIKELALECIEVLKDSDPSKYVRVYKNLEKFYQLESLTNEEFCRVRTSNAKFCRGGDNGETYFRISSTNFNWFDIIWRVVLDNKDFIKYITIVRDETVGTAVEKYYILDGKQTFQMPVDEFLTLPGNPIIK